MELAQQHSVILFSLFLGLLGAHTISKNLIVGSQIKEVQLVQCSGSFFRLSSFSSRSNKQIVDGSTVSRIVITVSALLPVILSILVSSFVINGDVKGKG